jgi:hypothetical protein
MSQKLIGYTPLELLHSASKYNRVYWGSPVSGDSERVGLFCGEQESGEPVETNLLVNHLSQK